jgi:16S rRNA (guanine527-N7)-methyltransferase
VTREAAAELEAGLTKLRIPSAAAAKLLEFGELVLAANLHTNLTGARNLTEIVRVHLLDSLAPLKFVTLSSPIIDVGSGAGFPGIPAAIAFPDERFVLLEPRAKRAAFLESAASELALGNVSIVKSSAGGPGALPFLGKAGLVLMRAIARPDEAIILGLPLVRAGGALLLYEGRSGRATPEQRRTAKRLGGGEIEVREVAVPGLDAARHAWIVSKLRQPGKNARH